VRGLGDSPSLVVADEIRSAELSRRLAPEFLDPEAISISETAADPA
jgi:hypothetical protein